MSEYYLFIEVQSGKKILDMRNKVTDWKQVILLAGPQVNYISHL